MMKSEEEQSIKTHPIKYFAVAMRKYGKGFYPLYALLIILLMIQPFINMFGPLFP